MSDQGLRLRLEDQLCFALYAATNTVVRAYRPLLAELGLTYPQYLLLMVLWEREPLAVHELADRLQLPAHGVSPLVRRLEDAGLVTSARYREDRRILQVSLTEEGRALESAAVTAQVEVVCRTGLDDASLASLRSRLHALVDQMVDPEPSPRRPAGEL